jgi:transcriptional regulator with XRE-family HTH domain
MSYGKELARRRTDCGISQEKLAQRTGISAMSILRYEQGRRTPTIDLAERIAKVLGCKLKDMLED